MNRFRSIDDNFNDDNELFARLFHGKLLAGEFLVCDVCHQSYYLEHDLDSNSETITCPHCARSIIVKESLYKVRLHRLKLSIGWKVAGKLAREWWEAMEVLSTGELAPMVKLAHELKIRSVSIEDFYRHAIESKSVPSINYMKYALELLKGTLLNPCTLKDADVPHFTNFPPKTTQMRNWTEEDSRRKLREARKLLHWENTPRIARLSWVLMEKHNPLSMVCVLVDWLLSRHLSFTDFFIASVFAKSTNIQTILAYIESTQA
jgi:DNA-directed RNA polymerase subunit RPC12/RpoP